MTVSKQYKRAYPVLHLTIIINNNWRLANTIFPLFENNENENGYMIRIITVSKVYFRVRFACLEEASFRYECNPSTAMFEYRVSYIIKVLLPKKWLNLLYLLWRVFGCQNLPSSFIFPYPSFFKSKNCSLLIAASLYSLNISTVSLLSNLIQNLILTLCFNIFTTDRKINERVQLSRFC